MASPYKTFLRSWTLVPFSIILMLYFVVGVDSLIGLGTVNFPASVACLLILFFFLLISNAVLLDKHMSIVLRTLEVPTDFALRTMNLYFTPSFILLPLSSPISAEEIGVLIGVFIVGYVVQYALTAYTCRAVQLLSTKIPKRTVLPPKSKSGVIGSEDAQHTMPHMDSRTPLVEAPGPTQSGVSIPLETLQQNFKDATEHHHSFGIEPAERNQTSTDVEGASVGGKSHSSTMRKRRWATLLLENIDPITYLVLLLCVGIPVFYATDYSMPLFLCLNILIFKGANAIPPKVKRVAHPVLVTAAVAILAIWVFALTKHKTLTEGLHLYRTDTSYMDYLRGDSGLPLPGAGDILAGLLDVSIVALAMPMYQYRRELWDYFGAIFLPVAVLTFPSLFGYPPLCSALGISATISIAVAPRSVTLALAQLSTENLGGNTSAISAIAVVSGISGPIFGPSILKFLRISEDDFVTVGVVLGANSSAIATAMLLEKDRRAAALSSLSMSLFGLLFVILTVIPPVVSFVKGLVGL